MKLKKHRLRTWGFVVLVFGVFTLSYFLLGKGGDVLKISHLAERLVLSVFLTIIILVVLSAIGFIVVAYVLEIKRKKKDKINNLNKKKGGV